MHSAQYTYVSVCSIIEPPGVILSVKLPHEVTLTKTGSFKYARGRVENIETIKRLCVNKLSNMSCYPLRQLSSGPIPGPYLPELMEN